MTPHSEGWEFSQQIEKYRGFVETAVFDRLGRPSFFDEAVEMVQMRVAETLKHLNPSAPTEEGFRWVIQAEARTFAREIEDQFVKTGILGVPPERCNGPCAT